MDEFIYSVGMIVSVMGAIAIIIALLLFVWWGLSCIWIAASNKFRDICKAESLIFEYRIYREQFMTWLKKEEGSWDNPTKKYCEDCGAKMDGGADL